ncbi:SGNH/GDSL hydrolase family protein [Pseudomonas sp. R5(2019)]|uniref:SGNH/GDSL hydrolase family protein n=1 Tax=Pseudomonas sp. R5(2019) TaxID=2697566 RepID=UPI001411E9BC|nr:SGNH/GDSL hydrolase family protein [Pseudomonas sp. R5(2019)]NBA97982.1 hypothetical protein [Pseudomonas sp. R5(2019)]
MELKNFFAQDDQGNALADATCYLYQRGTESLAAQLVKANGVTLDNPFSTDLNGLIQFAAPNGLYDIRVVKGARDFRLALQFNDVDDTRLAAEAAASRAEMAKDAAQLSAGIYVDIAAGLAATATSSNKYFNVPSPDSKEHLILYLNNSGVELELKRYPSTKAVETLQALPPRVVDIEEAYTEVAVREDFSRPRTSVFTADSGSFFGFAFQLQGLTATANYLDVHGHNVNANAKITLRIISRAVASLNSNAVPGTLAGDAVLQSHQYFAAEFLNTTSIQTLRLPYDEISISPDRIYFAEVKGLAEDGSPGSFGFGRAADSGAESVPLAGWYFSTILPGGTSVISTTARYSFTLGRLKKAMPAYALNDDFGVLQKDVEGIGALTLGSELQVFARWPAPLHFAGAGFSSWAFGVVPTSPKVDRIEVQVDELNYNANLTLDLWFRPIGSAYVGPPSAANGDVNALSKSYPVSDFGNTALTQVIELPFAEVTVPADNYLIIELRGLVAGGGAGRLGMGRFNNVTGITQIVRGYYRQGANGWLAIADTGLAATVAVRVFHHQLLLDGQKIVNLPQEESIVQLTELLTELRPAPRFSRTANNQFPATGNFKWWSAGFDGDNGVWDYLTLFNSIGLLSAATFELTLYRRATGYVGAPGSAGDTLIFQRVYTSTELNIISDVQDLMFTFDPVTTAVGETLVWVMKAFNADSASINIGMGRRDGESTAVQIQKGYYALSGTWLAVTTAGVTLASAAGAHVRAAKPPELPASGVEFDLVDGADVTLTVSGQSVIGEGFLTVAGVKTPISFTQAVTLPAAGSERFDLLVLNKSTRAVSLVAGTSRTGIDGIEYIPALPTGTLKLGVVLAKTALYVCSAAGFDGLMKIGREGEYIRLRERNRKALRKVAGKLVRGLPIKLAAYGDSIDAIQSVSGLGSVPYTANGATRDRPEYYFTNYAADTVAAIDRYDFGDGAGAVHCKEGRAWRLVEHLEQVYGSVVSYLNFGAGSTTSAATEFNGRWPERLAAVVAAAPDLAIISFGMNELGSTSTYDNVVAIAQALQAAGADVVIQGVPRINVAHGATVTTWRFTNAELERAALALGAAYVPSTWIADDRNLGGMGVPANALCATNKLTGYNHPGIYELKRYGESLVDLTGL